jgi:hypothetical protein
MVSITVERLPGGDGERRIERDAILRRVELLSRQSIQKRAPMPVVVAEPQSDLAAALLEVTGKISVDTALNCFIIILIR